MTNNESEHDFSVSSDEWEQRVFRNATLFRLHRFYGNGAHDTAEVKTFPEAVTMAAMAKDDPERPNARVLVYAVTDSGRHCVLLESRWPEYLKVWDETHPPQK